MKLILVRHGLTKSNLERRFLGVTDEPLAPEGAASAAKLAERIPAVERVYVSPLARCRQTALLLWHWAGQIIVPELRETDFGPFEGKTHEELVDDPLYNRWLSCPDDPDVVPQVENIADCARRASSALEIITADAKVHGCRTVGVVSHGGTLMSILARHAVPARDYYSWRMDNCGGYAAEWQEESYTLRVENTI